MYTHFILGILYTMCEYYVHILHCVHYVYKYTVCTPVCTYYTVCIVCMHSECTNISIYIHSTCIYAVYSVCISTLGVQVCIYSFSSVYTLLCVQACTLSLHSVYFILCGSSLCVYKYVCTLTLFYIHWVYKCMCTHSILCTLPVPDTCSQLGTFSLVHEADWDGSQGAPFWRPASCRYPRHARCGASLSPPEHMCVHVPHSEQCSCGCPFHQ